MPDGFPPFVSPEPGDFDTEADLRLAARSIIINRHRDLSVEKIDALIESDAALRTEYEDVLDQMHRPSDSTNLLRSGVKIFEVTESPEGEIDIYLGRFAGRYAIVNAYNLHYVPNRPRHSIAPWALNYGGKS